MADAFALLVAASLRVSGILGAAWLVTLTMRGASASARHLVWTCAMAAAVLTPVLSRVPTVRVPLPVALLRWSPAPEFGPSVAPAVAANRAPAADDTSTGTVPRRGAATDRRTTFGAVAVSVWSAGSAVVLLYLALGMIATSRVRRTATRATGRWIDDARALADAVGVARVTFAESALAPVPFVCGVRTPLIILPTVASSWTAERLRIVLLHELAHVKRRDCATQFLARCACAIYWFDPLAWVAWHRLHIERERACDDFVLTSGVRGSEYASHLVEIARSAVTPHSLFAGPGVAMAHRGRLEGRLMSILDPRIVRMSPLSARLLVAAFGLFALGAASLHLQAQSPEPSTSNQTFEVASIHRNKDVENWRAQILQQEPNAPLPPGRAQTMQGGRFLGRGMSVREFIRDAYGFRNRAAADVVGGPGWIDSERYNVEAKANVEFPASTALGLPPAAEAALRALLAERLHLRVRIESRRQRVYELVMARDDRRLGLGLTPAKGGCRSFYDREAITALLVQPTPAPDAPAPVRPCMMMVSLAGIIAENLTMEQWSLFLAAFPQINSTVIDRTGLTGRFDFKIGDSETAERRETTLLPAMGPVLESQLGLKLQRAEAPVDVLVIESVERPTEN